MAPIFWTGKLFNVNWYTHDVYRASLKKLTYKVKHIVNIQNCGDVINE